MTGWTVRQLTFGTEAGRYFSHSYYDIPVWDAAGRRIAGFETAFAGRPPAPGDAVGVGIVEADRPGSWREIGRSTAWSWQQGPMAQWLPGRDEIVWNDRIAPGSDAFVARIANAEGGETRVLPRPVYALDPGGRFALSLDMARLDALRPGYGYALHAAPALHPAPADDGVWRMPLDGGAARLVLPLAEAAAFVRSRLPLRERIDHRLRPRHYWFNHAKIAPGGARFTVKLRWRRPGHGWNGTMGVSLTCGVDGADLRLLARASSHVIWLGPDRLYFWDEMRARLRMVRDAPEGGEEADGLPDAGIGANVHLRHLPPGTDRPEGWVWDTPYAERVRLLHMRPGAAPDEIAAFGGHVPARGPFRCDLHPCPSPDGRRIALTSLQPGRREVFVAERA